jgi:hypothetical protein
VQLDLAGLALRRQGRVDVAHPCTAARPRSCGAWPPVPKMPYCIAM